MAATAALGFVSVGCSPEAHSPKAGTPELGNEFAAAMAKEQADATSAGPYLDVIDRAVASPTAPDALAAVVASLDALVFGATTGLDVPGRLGVAYRSRESTNQVVQRLRAAWAAGDPGDSAVPNESRIALIRGEIAYALHGLALFTGDEGAAETWGERRGCVSAATLIGPVDWTPLRGLDDPSPVAFDAPLAATFAGIAPFAARITPAVVKSDQCQLDVNASSFLQGVRVVVVDLDVPRAQRIYLSLATASATVVEVGGAVVMRREFELGGQPTATLGAVDAPQGRVRVVMRVAQRGDSSHLELDAWGEDGAPLRSNAPKPGDVARVKGTKPERIAIVAPKTSNLADLTVAAAAMLGLGDPRSAEHAMEQVVMPETALPNAPATPPALALLYARSVDQADDLPDNKQTERSRKAIDKVVAAWPDSWEGRLLHARVTERRRGAGDGVMEALHELGVGPGAKDHHNDRMVLAYIAALTRRSGMVDLAEQAYTELEKQAPGSSLLAATDMRIHGRVGADAVKVSCTGGGVSRADTDCFDARRDMADYPGAFAELARLRRLRNAPEGLRDNELSVRIISGDLDGAMAIYDAMLPGERRMYEALGYAAGRGHADAVKRRFSRDEVTARDAPYAIPAIVRSLHLEPDIAAKLELDGKKIVAEDRAQAFLPGAATAVLKHTERYSIEASGLVRYSMYDLRRVSGTTDVAYGANAYGPAIEGRGAPRLLRRRIHKKDGRILEPDASPNAAQASDLSQLETGDYVEQITEGYALPGDTGQLVIDTPDLLPERTSVREAEIELRRASSLSLSLWSHPLLGKPTEHDEGGQKVSVWKLSNAAPRRIEDGEPRMERSVGLSLGTQTWANVARSISEIIRAFDEHDPYVARWADEASGGDKTISKGLVERVVAATGKKVKIASSGELSDVAAIFSGGSQRQTARVILESGQGSRSWVIYRTLRELGVKADLAVAETEPFSSSESFPPHVGRFRHALVIAHVDKEDLWIDADIEGPPLPPGRISPELRGRYAMTSTGQIVTVAGSTGERGDEVDVRLALDEKGDAKGTFTILIHGRTAQALAEAFETVVGTERKAMLRSVVLGWLPWADVDDVSVSSTEGSWEIALRAEITIHGYGRPEGKDGKVWTLPGLEPVHAVFQRGAVGTLGGSYATRSARQSALSIDSPIQYHVHRKVDLPAGATVLREPAPVDVTDPRLQAVRKTTVSGQSIEESYTLSLPTGTIPAADYQGFVDKIHVVDDGFMAGTRVKAK